MFNSSLEFSRQSVYMCALFVFVNRAYFLYLWKGMCMCVCSTKRSSKIYSMNSVVWVKTIFTPRECAEDAFNPHTITSGRSCQCVGKYERIMRKFNRKEICVCANWLLSMNFIWYKREQPLKRHWERILPSFRFVFMYFRSSLSLSQFSCHCVSVYICSTHASRDKYIQMTV